MPRAATVLSTIGNVPISYFVYSSLSFFGAKRGGALPGMWFLRALTDAGRDAAAIRQTLWRMEKDGELVARKIGRAKLYAATTYAEAEIDAGTEKICSARAPAWDGNWTTVTLCFDLPKQRVDRERVVALLSVEGYAHLGGDAYIHPRGDISRLRDALPARARPHVIAVRGALQLDDAIPTIAARWKVDHLATRYRRVADRLHELERLIDRGAVTDRDAFLYRFAVVFEYLGVAWDDPGLPQRLLPIDWPGDEARRRAAALYRRLVPGATRYADRLLAETSSDLIPT